jgi:tryptophan-rich sensory protein
MIFEYYLVFSITTALCIVWLNRQAKIDSQIGETTFIFYTVSFLVAFLFSPVFFLIFLFYSQGYKAGIMQAMQNTYK